ncbi:uncharacterized protein LOC143275772 [Babylonia areolata]|uniref:uncharacterized protein LOC143275772 n=1 Tax=Babylonia areolata TaxID=304850 RepID=UPI003FD34E0F
MDQKSPASQRYLQQLHSTQTVTDGPSSDVQRPADNHGEAHNNCHTPREKNEVTAEFCGETEGRNDVSGNNFGTALDNSDRATDNKNDTTGACHETAEARLQSFVSLQCNQILGLGHTARMDQMSRACLRFNIRNLLQLNSAETKTVPKQTQTTLMNSLTTKTFLRIMVFRGNLKVHVLIHSGEKPHVCTKCGQAFRQKSTLNNHVLTHSEEKPHVCTKCGQTFRRKSSLKRHILTHSEEKPHVCTKCGQSFIRKSSLKTHILTHSEEKPHVCTKCGQTFRHKSSFNRHVLIHTGEKPYSCVECGKRFRRKIELEVHILTHTGEKPHVCTKCGKAFSDKRNLNRHLSAHQ